MIPIAFANARVLYIQTQFLNYTLIKLLDWIVEEKGDALLV